MSADASKRGRASRRKGVTGEQEIARLIHEATGWEVKRRVRQREGESDLEGVPGFAVEVKRHAKASRALIAQWWVQAANQALKAGAEPVLFFRQDRDEWRAVWASRAPAASRWRTSYVYAVEGSVEAWALVARELVPRSTLFAQNAVPSETTLAQEAA